LNNSRPRWYRFDVETEALLTRYDAKPGVSSYEGAGDAWLRIRKRIMVADTIIPGAPISVVYMLAASRHIRPDS